MLDIINSVHIDDKRHKALDAILEEETPRKFSDIFIDGEFSKEEHECMRLSLKTLDLTYNTMVFKGSLDGKSYNFTLLRIKENE